MRILLCDDDEWFLEILAEYCDRYGEEHGIPLCCIKFTKGAELLEYYRKHKDVDLCILDIMMEEINGLKAADEIRKEGTGTRVVFVTSALKYAPQGYVVGAKRYWMKPLSYEKFSQDMTELYEEMQNENKCFLIENTGSVIEKVYFDDIFYIETRIRKTCVHKKNLSYVSKTTMSDYEKKLDERFYRCHAAYIVNMYYIRKIEEMKIYLSNGEFIFISKGRRSRFIQAYMEFLQGI